MIEELRIADFGDFYIDTLSPGHVQLREDYEK